MKNNPTIQELENKLYFYKAKITKIYDADTITVDIDLGLNIWKRNESIRFARIDAPEIRGEERPNGLLARDFLLTHLSVGDEIYIETIKDTTGKYGRYIAEVYKIEEDGKLLNCNDVLVESNHAIYVNY